MSMLEPLRKVQCSKTETKRNPLCGTRRSFVVYAKRLGFPVDDKREIYLQSSGGRLVKNIKMYLLPNSLVDSLPSFVRYETFRFPQPLIRRNQLEDARRTPSKDQY